MRAVKSSLDQLLKRIAIESRIESERDETKRVCELSKAHQPVIDRVLELREEIETLESVLEKIGLVFCHDGSLQLSQKEDNALSKKHQAIRQRFSNMRDNTIIRLGLADDEERRFLLRNFFDEVAKQYQSLATVVGKLTLPKKK